MKTQIVFTAKLPIQITRKPNWFLASCSALDVATQGETEEIARKNISEALFLFLRSCLERGTLDAVLKECGFEVQDSEIQPIGQINGQEYVDVPLYLLSPYEGNR